MKNCSVEKCSQKHIARGYCQNHYRAFMRNGDTKRRNKKWGEGTILNGYRMVSVKGRIFRQHRLIMEKHLGRKLKPNESVHHIDHDKLNNSIENLQVMTKTEHNRLHNTTTFRNETHKQCKNCLKIKPRFLFYKRTSRQNSPDQDKHLPFCKECNTIKCRERYRRLHKNSESILS